jgi:hypothetical protein
LLIFFPFALLFVLAYLAKLWQCSGIFGKVLAVFWLTRQSSAGSVLVYLAKFWQYYNFFLIQKEEDGVVISFLKRGVVGNHKVLHHYPLPQIK